MERVSRAEGERLLGRDVPVWLADAGRVVVRANLLMLWAYGVLRIGEACDPRMVVGRHAYETMAQAVEDGVLSPADQGNREFFEGRLRAVLGTRDEGHPAVHRLLQAVLVNPEGRAYWEGAIAGYGGYGHTLAIDSVHYPVVLRHPDGTRLRFMAHLRRLDDGARVIGYEPLEGDEATRRAVAEARREIAAVYPQIDYVQDVRNLTEILPRTWQNVDLINADMGEELEYSFAEQAELPSKATGGSARGGSGPGTEWRPPAPYPREAIDRAFGQSSRSLPDHPVYGPGFAWALTGEGAAPTDLELFPERRWAGLRFVDGSAQLQQRGLIVDFLAVRTENEHPVLTLVSSRGGSGTLVNVYPNGDIDELLRRRPSLRALPPEALIFAAPAVDSAAALGDRPALDVAEAAARLGLNPDTVRLMLRTGRLAGFKQAGAWRVPEEVVEARRYAQQARDPKERSVAYNRDYYEQKRQDPEWRERRRVLARESMRRRRQRERQSQSAAESTS